MGYYVSKYWFNEFTTRYDKKINIIHNKKLHNLSHNNIKHPPSEQIIFNFSNRILTEEEKDILSLGLDFCLAPSKPKPTEYYVPYEKFAFNLSSCSFYNKTAGRKSDFITELKNISKKSFNTLNKFKLPSNISSKQVKVLKNLTTVKNIIILKPDKGNGIVILNKCDYINKMNDILNDNTKFQIIYDNITKLVHK